MARKRQSKERGCPCNQCVCVCMCVCVCVCVCVCALHTCSVKLHAIAQRLVTPCTNSVVVTVGTCTCNVCVRGQHSICTHIRSTVPVPTLCHCTHPVSLYPPCVTVPTLCHCTHPVSLYPPCVTVPTLCHCTHPVSLYPPCVTVPTLCHCTHPVSMDPQVYTHTHTCMRSFNSYFPCKHL